MSHKPMMCFKVIKQIILKVSPLIYIRKYVEFI